MPSYRIAHISDLHIPPLPGLRPHDFLTKRLLGLLSWHYKWKNEHLPEILAELCSTLHQINPDHICVTGDLTFTTHPAEIDQATQWLRQLSGVEHISLVPGNHDAYVPFALRRARRRWAQWMSDDLSARQQFPYLHRRGPVDIIGLNSAIALLTPRTIGRLGRSQLAATEALLEKSDAEQRPRVLLLHHPPQDGAARRAKELTDRHMLQQLLTRQRIDLVLHGHLHRPMQTRLPGRDGPVPVLGAGTASARGKRYAPAHFHLIEFHRAGAAATMTLQHGHYNGQSSRFELGTNEPL